jgi:hypothetical protein
MSLRKQQILVYSIFTEKSCNFTCVKKNNVERILSKKYSSSKFVQRTNGGPDGGSLLLEIDVWLVLCSEVVL